MNTDQAMTARPAIKKGARTIAKFSGVALSTISRLENGASLTVSTIEALRRGSVCLGIPFFGGSDASDGADVSLIAEV